MILRLQSRLLNWQTVIYPSPPLHTTSTTSSTGRRSAITSLRTSRKSCTVAVSSRPTSKATSKNFSRALRALTKSCMKGRSRRLSRSWRLPSMMCFVWSSSSSRTSTSRHCLSVCPISHTLRSRSEPSTSTWTTSDSCSEWKCRRLSCSESASKTQLRWHTCHCQVIW